MTHGPTSAALLSLAPEMRVFRHSTERTPGEPAAWSIGNFDGVHLGHQEILRRLLERGAALSVPANALVFDPHPIAVLRPDRAPPLLTPMPRRLELLDAAGVAATLVQPFDPALAALSPREFASRLLVDQLGSRCVVVGEDFRFGQGRAGDVELLRAIGGERGFDVEAVAAVGHGDAPVSSSRIRSALAAGDVEDATVMLGRPHDVDGLVVRGDGRGRQIGFPTANVAGVDGLLPRDGVYACWVTPIDGPRHQRWAAVTNVGVRPTFGAGRSVEAHLLRGGRDLYGERLRLSFVARLRDERRFGGVDELRAQISFDVARAGELLAGAGGGS